MDERSYAYEEPEVELSLTDVLWDLLGQWKAVLAVALVAAIAVPGLKLLRDTRSYQAASAAAQQEEAAADLPADEAVEAALEGLAAEDRAAVETLVEQQGLVDMQAAYLNDSLLLGLDPANQRSLGLRYRLAADDSGVLAPLVDGYVAQLRKEDFLRELAGVLGVDATSEAVYELVSAYGGTAPDSYASSVVLYVSVVLPEDADADAVADAVDARLAGAHDRLAEELGGHTLSRFEAFEVHSYNEAAMNRKSTLISSINNNRAAIKTAVAALSADQQAAYNAVIGIRTAELIEDEEDAAEPAVEAAASEELTPPSFSLKFAAVGLVVGVVLYAVAYVVLVMVRGRVGSAQELADYTRSRSLGEVVYQKARGGLLRSKAVSRRRYGSRGTTSEQAARAISTIESVCGHAGVEEVHVLRMADAQGKAAPVAAGIASELGKRGIRAQVVPVGADVDEKVLLPVRDAIFLADDGAKATDTWKMSALARSYDVNLLGCVFVKGC